MIKKLAANQRTRALKSKPQPNFELLADLQELGYQEIIGIDEVGRGALAGPLVVAAVELNKKIDSITDSKLISAAKRLTLAEQIQTLAVQTSFGLASVSEINELGLAAALKLAYERALAGVEADIILTDFVRLPGRKYISQPQGDRYFYPVAAAVSGFRIRVFAGAKRGGSGIPVRRCSVSLSRYNRPRRV